MAMLNNQRVSETIDFSHLWIGLRENRKPWNFSHEIWGFPAELFPLGPHPVKPTCPDVVLVGSSTAGHAQCVKAPTSDGKNQRIGCR